MNKIFSEGQVGQAVGIIGIGLVQRDLRME
jgi:hypothetical protein